MVSNNKIKLEGVLGFPSNPTPRTIIKENKILNFNFLNRKLTLIISVIKS